MLNTPPYGPRDDAAFLAEMNRVTRHHRLGCPEFARIWPGDDDATRVEDLPFLHVGLFKQLDLRTRAEGIRHTRVLTSSATSTGTSSRVALDEESNRLQSESARALLSAALPVRDCPLLILDHSRSLLQRGQLGARTAAALSLRPLATELHFLLDSPDDPASVKWAAVEAAAAAANGRLLVYGFTWILWRAWETLPPSAARALANCTIGFVHSGGWKKLEALRVDRATFDARLLAHAAPGSGVTDFYGLVEQPGMIYPLDADGLRPVPAWADVIVRDPVTLEPLADRPGQLQLLNPLSLGSPCHSVLTEDLGRLVPGPGVKRFELIGRIPKAEVRGCANV